MEATVAILSGGKNEERKAVSLTLKTTHPLPAYITECFEHDVRSAFPQLHRHGMLKTEFMTNGNWNGINGDGYLGCDCIVSPSGKWIASNSAYEWYFNAERNLTIWDSQTRMIRTTIKGRYQGLSFLPSPHGPEDYILLLDGNFKFDEEVEEQYKLVVWDHFHGTLVAALDDGSSIYSSLDLHVEANGKFLVVADCDGSSLSVWCIASWTSLIHTNIKWPLSVRGDRLEFTFMQVSPSKKWLLVRFTPPAIHEIYVWDTTTWTLYATLPHHEDPNHRRIAAAFSDNDSAIVAVCCCGAVQTLRFHTDVLHNTYLTGTSGDRPESLVQDLVKLSPDGRLVCWAIKIAENQVVNMSETRTGTLLWSVGARYSYLGRIHTIGFSPDGQHVATSYTDYGLRLLRATDGKCVASEGLGGRRVVFSFSRNGEVLILRFWEGLSKSKRDVKVFRVRELLERSRED